MRSPARAPVCAASALGWRGVSHALAPQSAARGGGVVRGRPPRWGNGPRHRSPPLARGWRGAAPHDGCGVATPSLMVIKVALCGAAHTCLFRSHKARQGCPPQARAHIVPRAAPRAPAAPAQAIRPGAAQGGRARRPQRRCAGAASPAPGAGGGGHRISFPPVAYPWPLSPAAAGLRAFVVVGRLAALTPSRRSRPRAAAGWCADGPPGGATARGTARRRSRAAGAAPHPMTGVVSPRRP